MSLRGRLLAASLTLVFIGLTLAGTTTYLAFRSFLIGQVDTQLTQDANSLASAFLSGRGHVFVPVGAIFFELVGPDGTVLNEQNTTQGSPAIPGNLPAAPGITSAEPITVASAEGRPLLYRMLAAQVVDLGANVTIIVAVPLTEESRDLGRLVAVELLVGLAVLMAAAVVGSWLVRLGLKPLGEIEATADRIVGDDFTERIPVEDEHTEVGRLGKALNTMLDRVEAAFEERRRSEEALRASEERLRQFVSDASHELRTPIAAVRANAELFRRGSDLHPEDVPAAMARIEAEAARMGLLVEDLLLLTRLDEGRPLEQAPVDLGALAADSVEAARTIEPERPVTLDVQGSVEVLGDRHRLRQVFDNLLANVRTHTPLGAPASVSVRQEGLRAIVEVADSGPGIDPAVGAKIFERFFRADPSRARDRGGAGLGLSIVAAITAAHGGRASASNRLEGGAVFRIDLPALVEAARPEPIAEPDADDLVAAAWAPEAGGGEPAGPGPWSAPGGATPGEGTPRAEAAGRGAGAPAPGSGGFPPGAPAANSNGHVAGRPSGDEISERR
jgi:two-component system OmpR family sensor kinase